ncbi:hypothetical protein HZP66_02120 [Elizabethkingia anophelis]|nr:hypothetical protein [Elizabethkingia anophelis]
MDKLELKDIAPYYAYDLLFMSKYKTIYKLGIHNEMRGKGIESRTIDQCLEMKPILRPMSDLTKEITHNGETFIPLHRILEAYCFDLSKMDEEYILSFKESLIEVDMSYKTAQMLHEMHFDTEKLIERGLAINLNEVDNGK